MNLFKNRYKDWWKNSIIFRNTIDNPIKIYGTYNLGHLGLLINRYLLNQRSTRHNTYTYIKKKQKNDIWTDTSVTFFKMVSQKRTFWMNICDGPNFDGNSRNADTTLVIFCHYDDKNARFRVFKIYRSNYHVIVSFTGQKTFSLLHSFWNQKSYRPILYLRFIKKGTDMPHPYFLLEKNVSSHPFLWNILNNQLEF